MSRSTSLVLALALAASPLAAQAIPNQWANRTMTGASFEIMSYEGNNLSTVALRSTHVGNSMVAPDIAWGVGYTSGVLVSTLDVGLGTSLSSSNVLFTVSAGPSVLGAFAVSSGGSGAAAAFGFHVRTGVIFPVGENVGARLELGRRYFFSNGDSIGLWVFGFGVTGLGRSRPAAQP